MSVKKDDVVIIVQKENNGKSLSIHHVICLLHS